MLKNVVYLIREGVGEAHNHTNLRPALDQVEGLNRIFIELEQLGLPANYIVRLRTA